MSDYKMLVFPVDLHVGDSSMWVDYSATDTRLFSLVSAFCDSLCAFQPFSQIMLVSIVVPLSLRPVQDAKRLIGRPLEKIMSN